MLICHIRLPFLNGYNHDKTKPLNRQMKTHHWLGQQYSFPSLALRWCPFCVRNIIIVSRYSTFSVIIFFQMRMTRSEIISWLPRGAASYNTMCYRKLHREAIMNFKLKRQTQWCYQPWGHVSLPNAQAYKCKIKQWFFVFFAMICMSRKKVVILLIKMSQKYIFLLYDWIAHEI